MNLRLKISALSLLVSFLSFSQSDKELGKMHFPEGSVQHVVKASDIKWQPCPPNLPGKCMMAVLEGNPRTDGLFTVRFKMEEEILMPPHTHPKEERVTIIEGKAYVGFGKDATKENATKFTTADYYVNARNAIHSVWISPGTIIQITGIGPWEVHFVEK